MRAILIFSAVLHIVALALFVAYGRAARRDGAEPSFPAAAMSAAWFGLGIMVAVTVLLGITRAFTFHQALLTGLMGGVVAALALLLCTAARPFHWLPGGPQTAAGRLNGRVFVGVFAVLELLAFSFLVYGATILPAYS